MDGGCRGGGGRRGAPSREGSSYIFGIVRVCLMVGRRGAAWRLGRGVARRSVRRGEGRGRLRRGVGRVLGEGVRRGGVVGLAGRIVAAGRRGERGAAWRWAGD